MEIYILKLIALGSCSSALRMHFIELVSTGQLIHSCQVTSTFILLSSSVAH